MIKPNFKSNQMKMLTNRCPSSGRTFSCDKFSDSRFLLLQILLLWEPLHAQLVYNQLKLLHRYCSSSLPGSETMRGAELIFVYLCTSPPLNPTQAKTA